MVQTVSNMIAEYERAKDRSTIEIKRIEGQLQSSKKVVSFTGGCRFFRAARESSAFGSMMSIEPPTLIAYFTLIQIMKIKKRMKN